MGWITLVGAAVAATAALGAGLRPGPAEQVLQRIAVAFLALATLYAAWLLANEDTRFELVVSHTRPGLSLPRRIMGLWGGSEGSLLFFTLILGLVLVYAPIVGRRTVLISAALSALSWTLVFVSFPFTRLTNEAIAGTCLLYTSDAADE